MILKARAIFKDMLEVIAKYRGKARFREQYLILGTTKDVQEKRV